MLAAGTEGDRARTGVSAARGRAEDDGDVPIGIAVAFADGGAQLSHGRAGSSTATDLRTQASRSLGEPQHRCGGA